MPPNAAQPLPRLTLGAAIGIALVAAALRFWQAGECLWLDELHTAWCAEGDLSGVATRAAIGNQSPLFFWLEWSLLHALGANEFVLRLSGLLAGSLLPLAVFGLGWRWTRSSVVALTAAALVAVDRTLIFYATEARPYAVVQLLAVVHVGIFTELTAQPRPWLRVAWIGIAALMFHLHYTAALLIPAELAFWCIVRIANPRETNYRPAMVAIDAAAVAALCLPALANLLAIFARRENWSAFVPAAPLGTLADWLPWTYSAPVAIAASLTTGRHRRFIFLTLAWLLAPAAIAWLATATEFARLFYPRYLMASAPAAIMLAAICADFAPFRWSRVVVSLLLVAAGLWNSGIASQLREDGRVIAERNEDWRGAIRWLNTQLKDQPRPVLVASGLIEADALRGPHSRLLEDYCVFPVTALYPIAAARDELVPLTFRDPGRLNPAVRQIVGDPCGAWLVVRGSRQSAERIAAAAKESGVGNQESVSDHLAKSFGNVQVLLLKSDP